MPRHCNRERPSPYIIEGAAAVVRLETVPGSRPEIEAMRALHLRIAWTATSPR
ncbi:MAG: hypothetical protein MZW92_77265 [Comamonadaceae bacterium]|nr:hypothetical protein [Comamonadaceae bacterium]